MSDLEDDVPIEELAIDLSPLEEALGWVVDPTALSAAFIQADLDYAAFVTDCVAGQGFEGFREGIPPQPGPEAFVAESGDTASIAEFGFGVI